MTIRVTLYIHVIFTCLRAVDGARLLGAEALLGRPPVVHDVRVLRDLTLGKVTVGKQLRHRDRRRVSLGRDSTLL